MGCGKGKAFPMDSPSIMNSLAGNDAVDTREGGNVHTTFRRKIEDAIFLTARDLPEPEVRDAFLERVCMGDASLRAAVEAMLADCAGAESFFSTAESTLEAAAVESATVEAQEFLPPESQVIDS